MVDSRISLIALALAAGVGASAFAAGARNETGAKDPVATPVTSEPQATTASLGDWVAKCTDVGGKHSCDVEQTILADEKGRRFPVAQIVFAKRDGHEFVVALVQIGVSVDTAPWFGPDEGHAIALTYRQCYAAGCLANAQPDARLVTALAASPKPARLVFKDAAGRVLQLPISVRGLAQARDYLQRQP